MIHPIFRDSFGRMTSMVLGLAACMLLATGCCSVPPEHQDQKVFDSSRSAVKALTAAVKSHNENELLALFGPQAKEIVSSGDPVADRNNREVFLVALQQRWTLQDKANDSKELVVGDDRWPFPIPLVKKCYGWRFDTEAGKDEVLARRIGRNELAVIGLCQTYVVAQKEYAREGRDGKPAGLYAQKVKSSPGKHDGLYWDSTKSGEKRSPLGDLAAQAESEGYGSAPQGKPRPFRGYHFRILTQQGKDARGGAKSYIDGGDMKGGFAMIAYPAEYGNSGIMTFIVNQDGTVLETDLGPDTLKIAGEIKEFNPDARWKPVD